MTLRLGTISLGANRVANVGNYWYAKACIPNACNNNAA